MAFPIVKIDSTAGAASDTACSGAGPTTALTGTAAATDAAGTTITITDAVDLSGVNTTGLAVLKITDATAGARNFGRITGVSGSSGSWTLTTSDAFGINLSGKSWAIGGVLATLSGATPLKLVDNNAAAGDAKAGWTIEFQSGHTETVPSAAQLSFRGSGDTTNGMIIIRGAAGGTRPIITSTDSTSASFVARGSNIKFKFLDLRNSTTGAQIALTAIGAECIFEDLRIAESTNKFTQGIDLSNGATAIGHVVRFCELSPRGASANGINFGSAVVNQTCYVEGCNIHDCPGKGINADNNSYFSLTIRGNVFANNTGVHVYVNNVRSDELGADMQICENEIVGSATHGVQIVASAKSLMNLVIGDNYIKGNLGWGVLFSNAAHSNTRLQAFGVQIRNNGFLSNSSGEVGVGSSPVTMGTDAAAPELRSNNQSAADPSNANYGTSGDYTKGSASVLAAAGWPPSSSNVAGTTSKSYKDVGAFQINPPAATTVAGKPAHVGRRSF